MKIFHFQVHSLFWLVYKKFALLTINGKLQARKRRREKLNTCLDFYRDKRPSMEFVSPHFHSIIFRLKTLFELNELCYGFH